MPDINPIQNGESADSVKAKLNAVIAFLNDHPEVIDSETGKVKEDLFPNLIIAGLRQGTKAELDAADPALMVNEPAWETDTEVLRVGDVRIAVPTTPTIAYEANAVHVLEGDIPDNWQSGNDDLTAVVIGSSCKRIGIDADQFGSYAFSGNDNLTTVTIPISVVEISAYALTNNTSLGSITIPRSVTYIGDQALNGCSNLKRVDCYVPKTLIDAASVVFEWTHADLVIHARTDDPTWTAGTGLTVGGNPSVDVIKDL